MSDSDDKRLSVLPASTAATSGDAMSGMSSEGMGHMAPVSIAGIARAPADAGGTSLKGTLRNGVLTFTLDARPVWWRIYGKQRLAAYAYNGIVPGPFAVTHRKSTSEAFAVGRR